MKLRLPVFILCCSLILAACKTEKECPAFDMADFAEFPYQQPDTLVFKNITDDTFSIIIREIVLSEVYTIDCSEPKKICPCLNSVEAMATVNQSSTRFRFLQMEQSDVSDMQYFRYNVKGFEFEFDFRNELPYINQIPYAHAVGDLIIGDTTYKEVVVINNEDTNSNISQVFFNKESGLLKFKEKNPEQIWSIQK